MQYILYYYFQIFKKEQFYSLPSQLEAVVVHSRLNLFRDCSININININAGSLFSVALQYSTVHYTEVLLDLQ